MHKFLCLNSDLLGNPRPLIKLKGVASRHADNHAQSFHILRLYIIRHLD